MRLDFCAAALAASSFTRKHEYVIAACVDEVLGHHPVVIEGLRDLGAIARQSFISVDGLAQIGKLTWSLPFDLGVYETFDRAGWRSPREPDGIGSSVYARRI